MRDEDGSEPQKHPSDIKLTQYRRPDSEQLEHIEAAAKEKPNDPTLWEWYAFTLYGLNMFLEAASAYRHALDLRQNPSSYYYLGNSLYSLGQKREAIRNWEEVVRLAPKSREGQRAREKIKKYDPTFSDASGNESLDVEPVTEKEKEFAALGELVQKEKIEALGIMAQGICHELNNPLMVITGFADLLKNHLSEGDEKLKAMPEKIKEAGKRCVEVIRRFSNFANRVGVRRRQEVELSQLIEEVVGILGASLKGQAIQVVTKLEVGLILSEADPSVLQLVFMSLISNAREAMPQGGLLEVTAQREKNQVRVFVRDNGIGMEKEDLAHLFEPFYTHKRNWEALGLGLAEAYVTIRQHGGTITCESEPGEGTTFQITLPLARKEVQSVPPSTIKDPLITPVHGPVPDSQRSSSVLLIDDDYDFMYLVGRCIEKRGYRVTMTSDVDTALDNLRSGQYRIILIDPMVSGPLLMDKLRQLRQRDETVPVLLMLGLASRVDVESDDAFGKMRSILKPFSLDELVRLFEVMTLETRS